MLNESVTNKIGTLKIRSTKRHTPALRLAVSALLNSMDFHPKGMPPSAILLINNLEETLPNQVQSTHLNSQQKSVWTLQLQQTLEKFYQCAIKPKDGTITAQASAVIFEDHAELMTSLCCDVIDRSVFNKWWWKRRYAPLFYSTTLSSGIKSSLLDTPRVIPVVISELARISKAIALIQIVNDTDAGQLLSAILHEYELDSLRQKLDRSSKDITLSQTCDQKYVKEHKASLYTEMHNCSNHSFNEYAPPWITLFSEQIWEENLSYSQALLLGVARLTYSNPRLLKNSVFENQIIQWWVSSMCQNDEYEFKKSRQNSVVPSLDELNRALELTICQNANDDRNAYLNIDHDSQYEKNNELSDCTGTLLRDNGNIDCSVKTDADIKNDLSLDGKRTEIDKNLERPKHISGENIIHNDDNSELTAKKRELSANLNTPAISTTTPTTTPTTTSIGDDRQSTTSTDSTDEFDISVKDLNSHFEGNEISNHHFVRRGQSTNNADNDNSWHDKISNNESINYCNDTWFSKKYIDTQLGGSLYLINFIQQLELVECLSDSWDVNNHGGRWALLELISRSLLSDQIADVKNDHLWDLFALLDQRDSAMPVNDKHLGKNDTPVDYRMPLDWWEYLVNQDTSQENALEITDSKNDDFNGYGLKENGSKKSCVYWCVTNDRIRIWKKQVVLIDQSIGSDFDYKNNEYHLRLLLKPYFSSNDDYSLFKSCNEKSPVETLMLSHQTHPIYQWISFALPFFRFYLKQQLGLTSTAPKELYHTLLQLPGRIYFTSSHVDLVVDVNLTSLNIRRTGLDQNPGWLPLYGRVVLFHFTPV